MAAHDANEQYLLELINRARLDPVAELARYNNAVATGQYGGTTLTNLNNGLAPGTITGAALQVLAPNSSLQQGSSAHSLHMLAVDKFAHSGIGDGDIGTRATGAGYNYSLLGENISWTGTTGALNLAQAIESQHFGLFRSDGHRDNLMNGSFSEGGMAQEAGQYTLNGTTYNASMVTEMFGDRSGAAFITGVVYNDTNGNRFYSIGEGVGGVTVASGVATTSASAGGYGLQVADGLRTVSIGGAVVKLNIAGDNIKLDLFSGTKISVSANVTLVSGVTEANLLGIANLTAVGTAGVETLNGNRGNNTLSGLAGNDFLFGNAGNDILLGGIGADTINGGDGIDTAYYYYSSAAVSVNLTTGTGASGEAAGDRLTLVENVFGSNLGSDSLTGNTGANSLYGFGGGDVLNGGLGNDQLLGGLGNDTLTGGTGSDSFYFNTALNALTNRDTITDYNSAADTIRLENTGAGLFTTLVTGALNALFFKANATGTATDADDRIIYNTATGALAYDSNGSVAGGAIQFATLTGHPAINAADFIVI
jgi:RTX calcium-binding nonapeptide repeat (4 copies)